jgi:hypothetical protein
MTGPSKPRSTLAQFANSMRDADPDGAWKFCRDAWHEQGVLILFIPQIDKRAGFVAARTAQNLGEQLFGKRSAK